MKQKSYGETIPVRFRKTTTDKIRLIATATGLNKSDVIRLAINAGLPEIEAGRLSIANSK